MANTKKPKKSGFSSIITFILLCAVGAVYYFQIDSFKKIAKLSEETQNLKDELRNLSTRISLATPQTNTTSKKDVVSLDTTAKIDTQKLVKAKLTVEAQLYCSFSNGNPESGDPPSFEAIYFKDGTAYFFADSKPREYSSVRDAQASGTYLLQGFDIIVPFKFKSGEVEVISLKISNLSSDQKDITGLKITPNTYWKQKTCTDKKMSIRI